MASTKNADLLNDSKVKAEIDRYKWIESEKAGYDIGFERAAKEWLNRNADSCCCSKPAAAKKTAAPKAKK
ncbi:MAG: hypothetical protein HQL18_03845 [Candidatus Omnitrophica bacterium]|nr:hypothetical protein [Candidatus Omnitrophota bacterium]